MFKIARAEILKVFRLPLFYIMVMILLASTYLFSFVFKTTDSSPIIYPSYPYSIFVSQKRSQYDALVNDSYSKIQAYSNLKTREENINEKMNNVFIAKQTLANVVARGNNEECNNAYSAFEETLRQFKASISSTEYIISQSQIDLIHSNQYLSVLADLNNLLNEMAQIKASRGNDYASIGYDINSLYESSNYTNKIISTTHNAINFIQFTLDKYNAECLSSITNYLLYYNQTNVQDFTNNLPYANQLNQKVINILSTYQEIINKIINEKTQVFINKSLFNNFNSTNISLLEKITINQNNRSSHSNAVQQINKSKITNILKQVNSQAIYIQFDYGKISEIEIIYNDVNEKSNAIIEEIEESNTNNHTTKTYNNITKFCLHCKNASDLINNLILENLTFNLSQKECENLYGIEFENFSKYKLNESIEKEKYCLQNATYDNSYISEPSLSLETNQNEKGLNYAYFSIKLASILILIFLIILSILLVTNEQKTGSFKFILSRPFSRLEIVLGKFLTIFCIGIIFMLFNTISSICCAKLLYGLPNFSNEILLVFNAQKAFSVSPIIYLIIFSFMQLLEIYFYAIIALLFSFAVWSVVGALISSCATIGIVFILNYFFKDKIWSTYLPFYNANLFKYFTSGVNSTLPNNIFTDLLVSDVYPTSNFWISLLILAVYSLIFTFITVVIHKRRDY